MRTLKGRFPAVGNPIHLPASSDCGRASRSDGRFATPESWLDRFRQACCSPVPALIRGSRE